MPRFWLGGGRFGGHAPLRTQPIVGVVWFLAADVCRILEFADDNVTRALGGLSPHQVNTLPIAQGIQPPGRGSREAGPGVTAAIFGKLN
jgi:prophage antirepressor-like protein